MEIRPVQTGMLPLLAILLSAPSLGAQQAESGAAGVLAGRWTLDLR